MLSHIAPVTAIEPRYLHQTIGPSLYAVCDIETGDADADAVQDAIENMTFPKNWKPETIERKRAEKADAKGEKAALLDAAPIICAGIKTDRAGIMFNGMDSETYQIDGWQVVSCGDEKNMLIAIRDWYEHSTTPDNTVLVNHRWRGFDKPKLLCRMLRHNIRPPAILLPHVGIDYDTQLHAGYFSSERAGDKFISLDYLCRIFGIPRPKQIIDGSQVPELHKAGEHHSILIYNAVDVLSTEALYLMMTGQKAGME